MDFQKRRIYPLSVTLPPASGDKRGVVFFFFFVFLLSLFHILFCLFIKYDFSFPTKLVTAAVQTSIPRM